MKTAGIFPPASEPAACLARMLALALVYHTVYAVGGGFITAVLSPSSPMHHVIAPGIVGLVAATIGSRKLLTRRLYPVPGIRLY